MFRKEYLNTSGLISMSNYSILDIVNDLKQDSFFDDYKFRKSDACLINKNKSGHKMIEFQFWDGFDLSRNEKSFVVKPIYLKRFNLLHKWFEKFSVKSTADQRCNFSIGFQGDQIGKINEFHFLNSNKGYEDDIRFLKEQLLQSAQFVFTKFSDLSQVYDYYYSLYEVDNKLPNTGADWVFEYLTLTKLVRNDRFEEVRSLLSSHVKFMNDNGEPNIQDYYPRFDEIISYLNSQKLK